MNKIYNREYYLKKIRGFYNSDLIKVISGVRRCGKSCFMQSVISDLKKQGIPEKDIKTTIKTIIRMDDNLK